MQFQSKGPADQILEEELRLLGWISKGIPPGQFLNMSFTDIDTVAAFGHYYDLSFEQVCSEHLQTQSCKFDKIFFNP